MPAPTVKIAAPSHMNGVYHPSVVMLPPITIEAIVMLTRYGIVRIPEPSAVVPFTA